MYLNEELIKYPKRLCYSTHWIYSSLGQWLCAMSNGAQGGKSEVEVTDCPISVLAKEQQLSILKSGLEGDKNASKVGWLEFVRIGISQNWNSPDLKVVRIGICQNRKLSELEFVRIGNDPILGPKWYGKLNWCFSLSLVGFEVSSEALKN